jgi:phosphoserine aminotransferase
MNRPLEKSAHARSVDDQAVAVPTADVSAKILARTVDYVRVLAAIASTPQKIAGKAGISIISS